MTHKSRSGSGEYRMTLILKVLAIIIWYWLCLLLSQPLFVQARAGYLHLLKILCKIPFVCIPTILTNVSSMLVDAVDCGLWWWWWPLPHKITPTNHSLECFCLLQKNQRLLILMYLITNLKHKWRWPLNLSRSVYELGGCLLFWWVILSKDIKVGR